MKHAIIRTFATLGLCAGAFLLEIPAYPQSSNPPASSAQRWQNALEFIANYLNLTDAQRTEGLQIVADGRQQAQPLIAQIQQGHDAVAAAVQANDTAAIDQLTAAQGALAGKLAAIHAKSMAKFYAILTPDQQAKAVKLHDMIRSMLASRLAALGV